MSQRRVNETSLTATADALRAKLGTSDPITWAINQGFKAAVESIQTGGGGTDVSGVTATETEVLENAIFVDAHGEYKEGTIPRNGDTSATFDGVETKSVEIPAGFTTGGTVALDGTIDNAVEAAKTSLANKGVEVPTKTDVRGLAGLIDSIPEATEPNLGEKVITENGSYSASEEGLDGYSKVEVNVPTTPGGSVSQIYAENVVNLGMAVSVETPSGVEYYYNHEQLPEIPADVMENYPYLTIMRSASTSVIRMAASTAKGYVHTEEGKHRFTIPTTERVWRMDANLTAGGWVPVGQGTSSWFGIKGSGSWIPWWANYDIPNGSPDATEIYLPAMEAETEAPAEPTHFYYNGVKLPEIPEADYFEYDYLMILQNKESSSIYIYASTTKPYYSLRSSIDRLELPSGRTRSKYDTETGAWGEASVSTNSTWCNLTEDWAIIWSNNDIPVGSADATDIYYYRTLAVPAD